MKSGEHRDFCFPPIIFTWFLQKKNMEGSCLRIGLSDSRDYLTFLQGLSHILYFLSILDSFCIFFCSEPIKQATKMLQFGPCLQYLVKSLAIFGQICGKKLNKGKRTNLAVHWFPLTLAGHWSGQMFLGLDTHRYQNIQYMTQIQQNTKHDTEPQ